MLRFKELTEKNLLLYAAKHYSNPKFSDIDDFHEDLKRFKYIKRLLKHWPVIKPFLIFLNYIKNEQYTGITMDPTVIEALRKI